MDQGGPTKYGVTQATLTSWLRRPAATWEVQALTPETVAPIYQADFFNAAHCDALPVGVDLMTFDEAVNEGVGRATRHLQEAAGVAVDGSFGPLTLAAVLKATPTDLINTLHDDNAAYYKGLALTFPADEKGWQARNDRTRDSALAMVNTEQQDE